MFRLRNDTTVGPLHKQITIVPYSCTTNLYRAHTLRMDKPYTRTGRVVVALIDESRSPYFATAAGLMVIVGTHISGQRGVAVC